MPSAKYLCRKSHIQRTILVSGGLGRVEGWTRLCVWVTGMVVVGLVNGFGAEDGEAGAVEPGLGDFGCPSSVCLDVIGVVMV
ncbi:hypothetical protein Tco_0204597 [Tanacetum coccineum]